MQVKFYEAFVEEQELLQQFLSPDVAAVFTPATIQESGDVIPPTRLISVRTQSRLPLAWAKHLDGVLSRSVGYDHLTAYRQTVQAQAPNIRYGYLPDYCRRAVAEQAILFVMALRRKLRRQTTQFATFDRDNLTGQDCWGAKMLVLGVGRIGGEVVKVSRALGMDVRGVDIDPRRKDLVYCSLEEGLAWADILVCALPRTEQTVGLVDRQLLQQARPGLVLVNIGRGEVTPLADLSSALEQKCFRGRGFGCLS